MKKFCCLCCSALLICFLTVQLYGDYLEASRSANIYSDPDSSSTVLERVSDGDRLMLLDDGEQTKGYYHVRTSTGQLGWIYRTMVRRHTGEIPEEVPVVEDVNPLADPTLHLTPEQRGYAVRHLRLGKPQAVYERAREGYVLAQDSRLKIPLWVQYELRPEDLNGPAVRRDNFSEDTTISIGARSDRDDYRNSGYDRGHMAPAEDMDRSQRVMDESFLLSNVAPQVGVGFNQHIWAYLEEAIRGWVQQRGALTIIVGPIFGVENNRVTYGVIGGNCVAVPTDFYKIVVDANNPDRIETLAFIMPNVSLSGRYYKEFLISIDEIEARTGLDFLSALPASVQNAVESQKASAVW